MKININIILIILCLIAFIIRIISLNSIPPGVFDDEANYGYDAWLLGQSGKDQWGNFLPDQFKGFGDYRLPFTQYLLVPFVKTLGLNAFSIRLPSAIFGSITVFIFYLLVKKILNKEKYNQIIALISAILLVFNPWHFVLSRAVMEANIGLFFVLLAIYFYLDSENNIKSFILSVFFSIMSFYTYYGYRFFLPAFFLILTIFNKKLLIKNFRKKILILALSLILILPILLSINEGGSARFKQVNFWQDKSLLADTNEYRGSCKEKINDNICKIFYNKYSAFSQKFILNYFNHFSLKFLFFPEFEKTWNYLPSSSAYFYLINIIPFIIGFVAMIKVSKEKKIFLLLLLAPVVDSLTGDGNFTRGFIMIVPMLIFIAYGWVSLLTFKNKIPFLGLLLIYSYSCFGFFINYLIYFPKAQSVYTHFAYEPLFTYLKQVENQYDHIYISNVSHNQRQYIFYLYYFKIPAKEYFNMSKEYSVEDNGWIWVKSLDKYNFIHQVEPTDNYPPKSLLVIDHAGIKNSNGYIKPNENINYNNDHSAFEIYDIDYQKKLVSISKKE